MHWLSPLVPAVIVFSSALTGAEHPRLLFSKDDIAAIKAKAEHPILKPYAQRLMARAELFLSAPPIFVSLTRRGEENPPGETKGIASARALQDRVLTYCMAFTLSGQRKYRDAAVKELDHALTNWKIWVDTAHSPPYDLMTGETCFTFGVAYDWLYHDLTADERTRIKEGAERRGLRAYVDGASKPMRWLTVENNWNTVCNGGAVVLALALEGESVLAAPTIDFAVNGMKHFWNHLPNDGAWDEGTGYWHFGMRYAIIAAEVLKRCGKPGGREVFEHPGVKQTCYFPLVFNPGTTLSASFGDVNLRASDAIFYLLGREFKNPDFIWFQDRAQPPELSWPLEALVLLWRPLNEDWLPEKSPDFAPKFDGVHAFSSIGWGMMAPKQPDPPYFLAFKNGSLGASHTHLDLNHVSVGVGDTMMLTDLGNRPYTADYFSGKRYSYYETGTAGHNTVMIGGKGQTHGRRGRLIGPVKGHGFDTFTGVADGAYEVKTSRARRTAVFVNKRYWVLLDDIATPEPQPVELRFHTYEKVSAAAGPLEWRIESAQDQLLFVAGAKNFDAAVQEPEGWIKPVKVLSLKSRTDAREFAIPAVIYPVISGNAPAVKFESDAKEICVWVGGDRVRFSLGDGGWKVESVELAR